MIIVLFVWAHFSPRFHNTSCHYFVIILFVIFCQDFISSNPNHGGFGYGVWVWAKTPVHVSRRLRCQYHPKTRLRSPSSVSFSRLSRLFTYYTSLIWITLSDAWFRQRLEKPVVWQGSLDYPFWGDQTMQKYGDVEGFPPYSALFGVVI